MGDHGRPLKVGDRIADRYVVERVLGQGGMGIVVAARHVELQQLFAIKFLLPDATKDVANTERLLREARAAARLGSRHVARVSDVGRTARGDAYLVMEYLEGLDLQQLLEVRGAVTAEEASYWIVQACDAIGEAHRAGIVHRDLKPANLFLARRPDGSAIVKVLDFGIAKEDAVKGAASMTTTGAVLGSPVYMAPEQVRSAKLATSASDIWALGVTLYELVTNAIPYDAQTLTELIASILRERPVPPSARRPEVDPRMEAIIMRCLERDPAARFRTADELAEALAPMAKLANPSAPLPQPKPRIDPTAPTLVGDGIVPAHTEAGTSTAIGRTRSRATLPIGIGIGVAITLIAAGAFLATWSGSGGFAGGPAVDAAPPTIDHGGPAAMPHPVAVPVEPAQAPRPEPPPPTSASAAASPSASAARQPTRSAPPSRPARPPPAPPPKPGWGGLL